MSGTGEMWRLMEAAYAKGFKNVAEVARYIGTTDQVMSNWKARGIPRKEIFRLSQMFNVSAGWLWTGEGSMKPDDAVPVTSSGESTYKKVKRIVFKLSAGVSGFSIDEPAEEKTPIYFRNEWLLERGYKAEYLYAVQVSGRSMEPTLYDGDTVVVDTSDTDLKDGVVVACNYEGEFVVKRLKRDGGQWWLSSDNSDKGTYPDKVCFESVFVIGRIVHKQSEHI